LASTSPGEKPFVWPQDQGNADQACIEVREGQTYEFTVGIGYLNASGAWWMPIDCLN